MVLSTITLNPAIDKTYYVNGFSINALNRAWKVRTDIGGKGINVSMIAAKCKLPTIAGGFLSGLNGKMIEERLISAGVRTNFHFTEGETRINTKVCDLENNTYTDINDFGPGVSELDARELLKKAADMARESDVLYMGGSFPPGVSADIYKKLSQIAREHGAHAVVDAGGEALGLAVQARPHIIKPNRLELELMLGREIKSAAEAGQAAREIVSSGVDYVLVTLGGNGAVASSRDGAFRAYPLHVPVASTVGAGDSFLAGFLYGKSKGADIDEALKFAVSFASAKIQLEGTGIPEFDDLVKGFDSVVVEKII